MNSKRVRLGWELSTLHDAIEGARILVDGIAHDGHETEHNDRRAPISASAILALVCVRLNDLGRVLRGELDPEKLAAPHNVTSADDYGDDDLILAATPTRRRKR